MGRMGGSGEWRQSGCRSARSDATQPVSRCQYRNIVTVAIDPVTIPDEKVTVLEEGLKVLGLGSTLPATEGGTLDLPFGTYGQLIEIDDQMSQLRRYYRSVVEIMRKLDITGRYFVNVAQEATFVCGEL